MEMFCEQGLTGDCLCAIHGGCVTQSAATHSQTDSRLLRVCNTLFFLIRDICTAILPLFHCITCSGILVFNDILLIRMILNTIFASVPQLYVCKDPILPAAHWIHDSAHYMHLLNTIHSLLHPTYYTMHTTNSTLDTRDWTLPTAHYTLQTAQCITHLPFPTGNRMTPTNGAEVRNLFVYQPRLSRQDSTVNDITLFWLLQE